MLTQVDASVLRIESAIASAEALTKKDVGLQTTEVFLKETTELRETLATTVIGKDDVVEIIQLLETVARDTNTDLSISDVVLESGGGWQSHERAIVVFSLEGSFGALVEFMGTIESLPVVARVENSNLEKSGARTWFGTFTVTVVKEKL